MSVHAKITPEAAAKLATQKRNSTLSALIISVLSLFLICLILFVIALVVEVKSTPEIISYATGVDESEDIEKPEMTNQVERKPSAPSSSMAKVIASASASPTAVPVPDVEVDEPSLAFGNGDDFGEGWGDGDGWGSGGGGGAASFFQQKVNAKRLCFVIDVSKSMNNGKRLKLLKTELARSVGALPESLEYQLIFFGGPAWVVGAEVSVAANKKSAIVKYGDDEYDWEKGKDAHDWDTKGKKAGAPEWLKGSKQNIDESLSAIESVSLVPGTTWEPAFDLALNMQPRPEAIFFMGDGGCAKEPRDSKRVAHKIATKAERAGVIINSVCMVEESELDAMAALAEITGGQLSLVKESGETKVLIEGK
ncbi:MAG: hypothetical protein ABGY95_10645 [Rubritalea sp.]|uniref:hypothetical protein n=1 Tax=Rubritalea sp. TaxID=2109375 RepID=UPI00324200A1